MEITYYLLQNNPLNLAENDFDLLDKGHLIQADRYSYYISFYSSQEDANAVKNEAYQYSASSIRYEENELNSEIIDCLKVAYKDIDQQWLIDLIESGYGYEDLEQTISEYMVAEYGDELFNYDAIVDKAKDNISNNYLSKIYKVCPISHIGSSIKLTGINNIIELLSRQPVINETYPGLLEKLTDYKNAADKTRLTKSLLAVDGTEFAKLFQVADKTVVSQWDNAVRKPDNFRLKIMSYIVSHPETKLVNYLSHHSN